MKIYLYDVINFSGTPLRFEQERSGHPVTELLRITTNINTLTGHKDHAFDLSYSLFGGYLLKVYMDGLHQLIIELFLDSRLVLRTEWKILKDNSRYSFVFEEKKVWFYSTNRDLALHGVVSDGWFVKLNEPKGWEPYNIINKNPSDSAPEDAKK